jgi:hypothetical protein
MSRLCERCVIAVNNVKKNGIKINKIYYSNNDGSLTVTNPTKLLQRNDHHITKYFKNNNYKPLLSCCDDCDECSEDDTDAA